MTNALRDKMVKELKGREEGLDATLKLTGERMKVSRKGSEDEHQLLVRAYDLSRDLTDIDEVLRLLEAR